MTIPSLSAITVSRASRVPGMRGYQRSSQNWAVRLSRSSPEVRRRSGGGGQTPQLCGPKTAPAPPDTDRSILMVRAFALP